MAILRPQTEKMLKKLSANKIRSYKPDDFRVLCAWCQHEIRAPRAGAPVPAPESHGICVACALSLGMPPEVYQNVA
jgi:hypothetical protein